MFSLDCDRVYQQQWRCSEVTVVSIQDYLAKVKKRTWVLSQCLTRVPENLHAARELLLYGLRGTDLEVSFHFGIRGEVLGMKDAMVHPYTCYQTVWCTLSNHRRAVETTWVAGRLHHIRLKFTQLTQILLQLNN